MKNKLQVLYLLIIFVIFSFTVFPVSSSAQPKPPSDSRLIGAKAAKADPLLTLEDMLTYAIQDEYLAKARYELVTEKFGAQRPFTNIIRSEMRHIAHLKPLFVKYNTPIPKDNAEDFLTVPNSLKESFKAGVQGEIDNIEMYQRFLKQDIPDDVRSVFSMLRNASQNHLKAFQKGLGR